LDFFVVSRQKPLTFHFDSFDFDEFNYRSLCPLHCTLLIAVFVHLTLFALYLVCRSGNLLYLPAQVLCGLYHREHPSLSTGIGASGAGLGVMIMPLICAHFIHEYTWKTSLHFVSSIMLHLFVFSALLRDPPEDAGSSSSSSLPEEVREKQKVRIDLDVDGKESLDSSVDSSVDWSPVMSKNEDIDSIVAASIESYTEGLADVESSDHNSNVCNDVSSPGGSCVDIFLESVDPQDIGTSVDAIKEPSESDESVLDVTESIAFELESSSQIRVDGLAEQRQSLTSSVMSSRRKRRRSLRHVYLFTDFDFNVYFLNCIMWSATKAALVAFGPDVAYSSGVVHLDSAGLLMGMCGGGVFLGAILAAIVGNVWKKKHLLQFSSACILCSVGVAIMPLCDSFTMFAANMVIVGLCTGTIKGLYTVVLIDLMGMRNLAQAIGFTSFANGIGAFIGPVLAGMFCACAFCYFLEATLLL
jgi:hypothetical protein